MFCECRIHPAALRPRQIFLKENQKFIKSLVWFSLRQEFDPWLCRARSHRFFNGSLGFFLPSFPTNLTTSSFHPNVTHYAPLINLPPAIIGQRKSWGFPMPPLNAIIPYCVYRKTTLCVVHESQQTRVWSCGRSARLVHAIMATIYYTAVSDFFTIRRTITTWSGSRP